MKTQFRSWNVEMSAFWLSIFLLFFFAKSEGAKKLTNVSPTLTPISEPVLSGPESLCIIFGSVVGTYSAGGDPGDVYEWTVTDAAGTVIFNRAGGIQLETIQVVFGAMGNYSVVLQVRRGTNASYYSSTLSAEVQKGPELALLPDYLLCAGSPTLLTALDPNAPDLAEYTINWKDLGGNLLGTGNEYLAYSAGYYLIDLFRTDASGAISCVVDGSTFVGPPIDFMLMPSTTAICEGESITIGLDTPLSGDWFIQKDFSGTRSLVTTGFEVNLTSTDLSGPGLYLVTFQTTSADYTDCISERTIGFELKESPRMTATVHSQPDDCSLPNGSFQIQLDTDIDALYIPELNIVEGPRDAGTQLTYSNLLPQVYSVVVEKAGCQITTLFVLDSKNPPTSASPPAQLKPSISSQSEVCSPTGIINGGISIDFGTTISTGNFRILSIGKGQIQSGNIPSNGQLTIDLLSGSYLLEMKVDGCTYPIHPFDIGKATSVDYTVPLELNICESFMLQPETEQNLRFTLTFPDGTQQSFDSGQSLSLTKAGSYSILAEGQGANASLCPQIIDFTATLSSSITFAPILAVEKCFDPIKYEIDLQGITLDEASIRWLNDENDIVGRGPTFYPVAVGYYSLLVQPLASGFCPVSPVEFEVVAPITSVPMEMEANKICPSPGTATVTLTTLEEEVADTEWIFYDLSDSRTELTQFDGLFEIEVDAPGSYEAVAYNQLGCEIGRSLIPVESSTLLDLPVVEERYGVCSEGQKGPFINPGDFAEYYWYYGEELVSTIPEFSPKEAGKYELKVVTVDGCEFFDSFETFDACSFDYVFPDAMILGDPARNFEVTVSEGITEAELYITNRQGALIHYSKTAEIAFGEPILEWDGKSQGTNIPTGTYVVVLIGRNPMFQFEKKITGSLLVIE